MQTYFREMIWDNDPECGNFGACVIAEDDASAERLIALDMMRHTDAGPSDDTAQAAAEWLAEHDYGSLAEYYASHGLYSAWGDLKGHSCPNCTAHGGKIICGSNGFECGTCGYKWVAVGMGPKRAELEEAALMALTFADEIDAILAADEPEAQHDATCDAFFGIGPCTCGDGERQS